MSRLPQGAWIHQSDPHNPLFLRDGIPIFNMEKLMSYDPGRIRTTEIVVRRYYRGRFVNDGIVNRITYDGIAEG